jgi:hypothetical protein
MYDRTLLYSGAAGVSSCTLSEPASAFESISIGLGPVYESEIRVIGDRTNVHVPRWGAAWNAQSYLNWPYNFTISNGTKKLSIVASQLICNNGPSTASVTVQGLAGNSANNVKMITNVYGNNRKQYSFVPGLGLPGDGWRAYNETLLWSATVGTAQKSNPITLSRPANIFERLKFCVGAHDTYEGANYLEVSPPTTNTAWINLESWWGANTASYYVCFHRYRFSGWNTIMPISGKSFQLGTAAANPYTATGNYTSTERYVRYPVNQIWGINTKY